MGGPPSGGLLARTGGKDEMSLGDLLLCFVPLFVAMDAVGAVPVYVALTDGLSVQ